MKDCIRFSIPNNCFHVFEFKKEYILFDRVSGLVCEINEFAYDLFRLIEAGKYEETILYELSAKYSEPNIDLCFDAIKTLKGKGFFKPILPWPGIDCISFENFWHHRPRRIQLMMAQSCNLKCGYCYAWRNDANSPGTYMNWDTAKQATDFFVRRAGNRSDLQVTFFGGEPLLNLSVLKQTVDYCKSIEKEGKHRFCFELITNGTLLTREVSDYAAEHNFLLFISIDGWQEMHNHNRPSLDGRDFHETILQNALYANAVYEKNNLPKIKIRANLTNHYSDLRKVVKYLESFGFEYIGIGAIEPLPHGDPCGMAFSEEQMYEMAETMTDMMLEAVECLKKDKPIGPYIQRAINKTAVSMVNRSLPGVICGVCRNTAIVDNKGGIFPCHRYASMEAFRVGNVFTGMEKAKVIDYYKKITSRAIADCQDCWIRNFCAGGCPWSISDKNGVIHSLASQTCERLRQGAERSIWLRKELYAIRPSLFDEKYQYMMNSWDWDDAPDEFY